MTQDEYVNNQDYDKFEGSKREGKGKGRKGKE
jgi:hypothetical protein